MCSQYSYTHDIGRARFKFGLLPADTFIRDHLTKDDCIVMSCGGNDIALNPTLATVISWAGQGRAALLLAHYSQPSSCSRCRQTVHVLIHGLVGWAGWVGRCISCTVQHTT